MGKSDLARVVMDYQNKFDIVINNINSELLDLKNEFTKFESDLEISRNVNNKLVIRSQDWSGSAGRMSSTLRRNV